MSRSGTALRLEMAGEISFSAQGILRAKKFVRSASRSQTGQK
jgi:hypothetical protein